jgi:hypothetical protein
MLAAGLGFVLGCVITHAVWAIVKELGRDRAEHERAERQRLCREFYEREQQQDVERV